MDSLQRDPLLSSQIKHIYGLNSKRVELIEDKRILKNPVDFGMSLCIAVQSGMRPIISYDHFSVSISRPIFCNREVFTNVIGLFAPF